MPSSSVPRHRPILKQAGSTTPQVVSVASPTAIPQDERAVARTSLSKVNKADTSTEQSLEAAPALREKLASLPPLVVERDSAISKELLTDWRFDC